MLSCLLSGTVSLELSGIIGRYGAKAYADAFDLVHRHEAAGPNAVWQADHTELDIVLKDGRNGLPIATEKKPTNLARSPDSAAFSLLETRLRRADSRRRIRERLSRTKNTRDHEAAPESLGASRLPSFSITGLNNCHPEDSCFFLRCYRKPFFRDSGAGKFTDAEEGAGQRRPAREPENSPTGRPGPRRPVMTHVMDSHNIAN
jgi:hypothetical protein